MKPTRGGIINFTCTHPIARLVGGLDARDCSIGGLKEVTKGGWTPEDWLRIMMNNCHCASAMESSKWPHNVTGYMALT